MQDFKVFKANYLFDGEKITCNKLVITAASEIAAVVDYAADANDDEIEIIINQLINNIEPIKVIDCGSEILAPGFIDLQINGCGGVNFNQDISEKSLETMYQTSLLHATTSFLPTLITCDFADVIKALDVVSQWCYKYGNKRGVFGIHLEGPFIAKEKSGIHPEQFILKATDDYLAQVVDYSKLFTIKMTIAVECVSHQQIKYLSDNGVIVAIGHSNATASEAIAAISAGVTTATHTFNAMSGLSARSSGVIGAILTSDIYASVIADMHHVEATNIKLLAKIKPDKTYLVTDAVAPSGTELVQFSFAGKQIEVVAGKCIDQNGTLSGANLTLDLALQNCVKYCALRLEEVLKMVTLIPAKVASSEGKMGKIAPGYLANLITVNQNDYSCKTINRAV